MNACELAELRKRCPAMPSNVSYIVCDLLAEHFYELTRADGRQIKSSDASAGKQFFEEARCQHDRIAAHETTAGCCSSASSRSAYFGVIPIVSSHLSTSLGHSVIGNSVRRSPNA
jgi:hypothetical protein